MLSHLSLTFSSEDILFQLKSATGFMVGGGESAVYETCRASDMISSRRWELRLSWLNLILKLQDKLEQ